MTSCLPNPVSFNLTYCTTPFTPTITSLSHRSLYPIVKSPIYEVNIMTVAPTSHECMAKLNPSSISIYTPLKSNRYTLSYSVLYQRFCPGGCFWSRCPRHSGLRHRRPLWPGNASRSPPSPAVGRYMRPPYLQITSFN